MNEIQEITWRKVFLQSWKLILTDFVWGFGGILLGLAAILLSKHVPVFQLCESLQFESGSDKDFHLPHATLFLELGWNSVYHTIPLAIVLLVMDSGGYSSCRDFIQTIHKRWGKAMKIPLFFFFLEFCYRMLCFFVFVYRNSQKYPHWATIPIQLNWLAGAYCVINKSAQVWTQKQSSYLILQKKIPQDKVHFQSQKVQKNLRRKLLLAVLVPAIYSFVLYQLSGLFFQVSFESHRALLIVFLIVATYPLWTILDRLAKKPIGWSHDIKMAFNTNTEASENEILSVCEQNDPILFNGVILSGFILTGTTILTRILQANMETLVAKLATGLLASSLESIFVVMKPYLSRGAQKKYQSVKLMINTVNDRVFSGKINPNQVGTQETNTEYEIQQSKNRIDKWHRMHAIIFVNRLEMAAIMFGSTFMMAIVGVRDKVEEHMIESSNTAMNHCSTNSKLIDFTIAMLVLSLLEMVIEFFTYTYLIKFERLQLIKVAVRMRMKLGLVYFILMVTMYFFNIFLVMGYSIMSCGKLDVGFYEYHCTK